MPSPADWQLPIGVSRGMWEYAHDTAVARDYDAGLAGTPLLAADRQFVSRHLQRPGRVIDIGCGTGRVAIELAAAGHRVVGLDLSEPMLAVARAKPGGSAVNWVAGNVVDLSAFRDRSFDAAVCLFSTLGMVAGQAARSAAVREAFRVLRPGGVYVVHGHLVEHHLTTPAGRRLWLRDCWRRLTWRPDAGDFPMAAGPAWAMHLFTRRELTGLLRSAGFEIRELVPVGVDGRPCRPPAYGLLAAAAVPTGGPPDERLA